MRTKHCLYAAIAFGLGFSSAAPAVYLNPRGTGQVLVYPYYTANANQATLLTVVNTTPHGKALRMAFREGYNGRLVLSFNVYLSAFDVWSAEVAAAGSAPDASARIATADNSCTFPVFASADFRPFAYTGANGDTGPQTLARTREGHFDVIEMGEVTNATHGSLTAITQGDNGVPANCAQVVAAWTPGGYWTVDPTVDLAPPGGGLYGSESIVDVAQGTIYAINAEAVDGFSAKVQHTSPGDAGPDLNSANDAGATSGATALVPIGGGLVQANYTHPVDAISALFMADVLYNEYDIDPTIGAASDWVVTFPTKRFYVDPVLNSTQDTTPFDEKFGAFYAGESCAPFATQVFNRDELTARGFLCGTPPAATPFQFCFETSVAPIGTGQSVLGSQLLGDDTVFGKPAEIGIPIAPIAFSSGHVSVSLTEGTDACFETGPDPLHVLAASTSGQVFQGMPAIGFLARNYINANVSPGVLSNYSAAQPHRASASCKTNTMPAADCQ